MDMDINNPTKFEVRLSKLENGKFLFQYEIERTKPLHLQITVKTCEADGKTKVKSSSTISCVKEYLSTSEFYGVPGKSYIFTITYSNFHNGRIRGTWQQSIARSPRNYQYMTKEVLHARMNRASNFYHGNYAIETIDDDFENICKLGSSTTVKHFSRSKKPLLYWSTVQKNRAIETSIRTGNQGHPSMLNYSYGGIYFFAVPHAIGKSPFGKWLNNFTPDTVLGEDPVKSFSYFFSDVKCYGDNAHGNIPVHEYDYKWQIRPHYITIAICRKQSQEESYCKEHLIELKPHANPFFVIDQLNANEWEFKVYEGNRVWIEIFLMERLTVQKKHIWPDKVREVTPTRVITEDCSICVCREKSLQDDSEDDSEEEDDDDVDEDEDDEMYVDS